MYFSNYGKHGKRGAWEIDHSKPRSNGGTDHGNNLYAAHTSCNRAKQAKSNRVIRAKYGQTAAPISKKQREKVEKRNNLLGWCAFAASAVILVVSAGRIAPRSH